MRRLIARPPKRSPIAGTSPGCGSQEGPRRMLVRPAGKSALMTARPGIRISYWRHLSNRFLPLAAGNVRRDSLVGV